MPVTLAQARTEVRSLLNEPNAVFWSDSQLNSWINQGCQDIARRSQTLWDIDVISAVAYTQNYDLPSNFISMHRVEFSPANSDLVYPVEYRGVNTMDDVWGIIQSLPSAQPEFVTVWGTAATGLYVRLYPVPGQDGTLNIWYYRDALIAEGDSDPLDILPGWEDLCYDYAVFKAKRADRDTTWNEAKQLYEMALAEQINNTRNMTDLGENISGGTGSSYWPAYLYGGSDGW